VEPPVDNGTDLACFSVNKVKLHRYHGMNKDKLQIKYAGFRMVDNVKLDLTQEDVFITVDGIVYEFPAGSFKQRGIKHKFEYKSPSHETPKIKASIDFDKSKWSLKVSKADATYIDNSDGVDISLSMGGYQGSENVMLKSKNKHHDKLMFKRKPKAYCRIDKEDDDHDDDDDHDKDYDKGKHKDRDHDDDDDHDKDYDKDKHKDRDYDSHDDDRDDDNDKDKSDSDDDDSESDSDDDDKYKKYGKRNRRFHD